MLMTHVINFTVIFSDQTPHLNRSNPFSWNYSKRPFEDNNKKLYLDSKAVSI